MTEPVLVDEGIPVDVLLHPRFSVAHEKEDGSLKIKPVDNISWSDGDGAGKRKRKDLKVGSINGHTLPQENMRLDTLDRFIGLLTLFAAIVTRVPMSVRPGGGGPRMRPFGTFTLSKKISALSPMRRPIFDMG